MPTFVQRPGTPHHTDTIDVKKRFYVFFLILVTFLTFFIFQTFVSILKKTLAKFRAASRLTRSTFKMTATKFSGFMSNRILYPVIRM